LIFDISFAKIKANILTIFGGFMSFDEIKKETKTYFDEIFKNPIFIFYTTMNNINNLKNKKRNTLKKAFKTIDIGKVIIPPEVKVNREWVHIKGIDDEKIAEMIVTFTTTLQKNFNKEDLALFYRNAQNISIHQIKTKFSKLIFSIEQGKNVEGLYAANRNSISINPECIDSSFFHELFHMATAYSDKEKTFCGFGQGHFVTPDEANYENIIFLGKALNEGYTEIMTNRYFGVDISKSGYSYYIEMTSKLEEIVGSNFMEKQYMHANLKELIIEVSKYATVEDTINYIKNMDFHILHARDKNKTVYEKKLLRKCKRDCALFLINTFENKMKMEYNNGNITACEALNKLDTFTNSFLENPKHKYYLSKEDQNNIINTIKQDFNIYTVEDYKFAYYREQALK
jgi:hypothetical protein